MNSINAVKIGKVVNVSINGKLHKKVCGDESTANQLFKTVLDCKKNPTENNINKIYSLMSETARVALHNGLEHDLETGEIYMAGFNTPIPKTLFDVIVDYNKNGFEIDPIINFWMLLMINPDKRIRERLFDFIQTHDFSLTDKGYMVVYKAVNLKQLNGKGLDEFVSNNYLMVKKNWKCSPNKYVVYLDVEADEYAITKKRTYAKWEKESKENVQRIGLLGDLYLEVVKKECDEEKTVYTDIYSGKMKIVLGKPVGIKREECDADFSKDCSYGLHVGATKYVERFGSGSAKVLVCFVNPANVVAVPDYDHSKIRVSEYFPFALANYVDGKIDVVEESYFEDDYCTYELDDLQNQIDAVKQNEQPRQTALNACDDERPLSELMKVLQSRVIDIDDNLVELVRK